MGFSSDTLQDCVAIVNGASHAEQVRMAGHRSCSMIRYSVQLAVAPH
jgi:hypothetical protein